LRTAHASEWSRSLQAAEARAETRRRRPAPSEEVKRESARPARVKAPWRCGRRAGSCTTAGASEVTGKRAPASHDAARTMGQYDTVSTSLTVLMSVSAGEK